MPSLTRLALCFLRTQHSGGERVSPCERLPGCCPGLGQPSKHKACAAPAARTRQAPSRGLSLRQVTGVGPSDPVFLQRPVTLHFLGERQAWWSRAGQSFSTSGAPRPPRVGPPHPVPQGHRLSSQAPGTGWLVSDWWKAKSAHRPVSHLASHVSSSAERMFFHTLVYVFCSSILTSLISENSHDY